MKTTTVTYVCEACEEEIILTFAGREPTFPAELCHYSDAHKDMELMHPESVTTEDHEEAGRP